MNRVLFAESLQAEQYRMSLLQVLNWGTFSGLHRIPIARDGFLFIGRSGSGKSTLLDAMSALLVPPQWRGFNAAAQEDKRKHDRNLALYVRGAWSDQTDVDSGEIATQFLRAGTTWSAVALEYQNLSGKAVTLIALFILRGQHNRSAEVQTHFMIAERSFDFGIELSGFDLDIRKLKQKFADIYHADQFKAYSERFRLLLGIDSEMTLKLLHKTQSAKSLGDLNLFLREYMLDEPDTFAVADRLINEFSELDAAHQTVVTAREQVQLLAQAREHYQQLQQTQKESAQLQELNLGIDSYCVLQEKTLLQNEIKKLNTHITGLVSQQQSQQEMLNQTRLQLRRFETQHREQGGEQIENLQEVLQRAEQTKQQRLEKYTHVEQACQKLKQPMPDTPQNYAAFISQAQDFHENWQSSRELQKHERNTLQNSRYEVEKEFAQVRQELQSLQQQPSNIPAQMLQLRQKIITALSLQETDLPFVGELVEVQETAAIWRGAIERVLHGFALSLLVSERHYAMVSNFVNENYLGSRLVYYRIQPNSDTHATITSYSLINKLNLKKGDYFAWLEAELKRRFNYACVDNLQEFRKIERALTKEGQIRHGKSQHEKDDRHAINDKKYWILGFDNKEKLKLFEQQAQQLAEKISNLDKQIKTLEEKEEHQLNRALVCQSIVNISWTEINIAVVLDEITQLNQDIQRLQQGNIALKQLGEKIEQQQKQVEEQQKKLNKIDVELSKNQDNLKEYKNKLESLNEKIILELSPFQREELNKRFSKERFTLNNLGNIALKIQRIINEEHSSLLSQCAASQHMIERIFQKFKDRWPQESADLDVAIDAAPEFLAKLIRIEGDGLPNYEERFFNMLREQSMENLAALNTHLSQARKDIMDRMEFVNESLAAAEYNVGTHLQIEVLDRLLEPVKNFRVQIREVLSHAWNTTERELAEKRFASLRSIVEQLRGQDNEQQRWRQQVLDVRLHVEFIAKEYNDEGKEIEVHRSGAGKSGGQREKLATTCLAAALCYQLGGQQQGGIPLYAPVVLDEAFSKADNEFTQEVMKIFTNFGFQMIVATPFKSVMTLEPFIAGACFVDIAERKHSSTLQIQYKHEEKRLDLPGKSV